MLQLHSSSRALLAALAIALAPSSQAASDYPSRPIRVIVGAGAGGGQDAVGRLLAEKMAPLVRGTFVIENRPGAAGQIAAEAVAKAAPDGYTMLLGGYGSHVLRPAVAKLPYDPIKDFTPIGSAATASFLVVGPKNFPANNLRELIALAKAKPGLQYGTSGNGSTGHFCAELLNYQKQMHMEHIPYRSSSQVQTDLLGGVIALAFLDIATAAPLVKAGQVKAVGSCVSRSPAFPDVPSYEDESISMDGMRVSPPMQAFFFPANTPAPIVDKIAAALKTVLAMPEVKTRLFDLGNNAQFEPGDVLREHLISDGKAWKLLAQRVNIVAE